MGSGITHFTPISAPRSAALALALVLPVTSAVAAKPSLALPGYPGVTAVAEFEPASCPSTLPVTVKANDEAVLADGTLVRKVMGWAQLLAEDCRDAAAVRLTAHVKGKPVYKAIALRADGWAMTEVRLEEPKAPIRMAVPESAPTGPAIAAPSNARAVPSPAVSSSMTASGTDRVGPCDKVGAHPQDPEAVVTGVDDEALDAQAVIEACGAAVKADPATPRLKFQLARGYLKSEQVGPALEQLLAAAEEGHGPALAHLGDLYLHGAPGIEADPQLAITLYGQAARSGFEPAKVLLDQFEDWTAQTQVAEAEEKAQAGVSTGLDAASFKNPKIVLPVFNGDLDKIEYGELYTKAYLIHMADNIGGVCEGAHFTPRDVDELRHAAANQEIKRHMSDSGSAIMGFMGMLVDAQNNPAAFAEREMKADLDRKYLPEEAMNDAFKLMESAPCKSAALDTFSKNLRAYVTDQGAPVQDLMGTCMAQARPTGAYRGQDFCVCFIGALKSNTVSRSTRVALTSNFWPTATKLMDSNRSFGKCHSGIGR